MANVKNVTGAFLDGFASLSALFEPTRRPGSLANLISDAPSPAANTDRFARQMSANPSELLAIASRLRHSADLLERGGLALRHAAATHEPASTHGAP